MVGRGVQTRRRCRLDTFVLSRGINPRAIVALVVGVFVALVGLAVPAVRFLYDYAWFVGFFLSAVIYYLLMRSYKIDAR